MMKAWPEGREHYYETNLGRGDDDGDRWRTARDFPGWADRGAAAAGRAPGRVPPDRSAATGRTAAGSAAARDRVRVCLGRGLLLRVDRLAPPGQSRGGDAGPREAPD